ncbi:hypothetical protein [Pseudonocardia oroxyli]|uniref:Uncharacterized protein n=1 Tax=Pseudonocardia oroxyli TaxID=366584 RepID=A0A1G8AF05_PSEOR|nr:hypothetical protein [Pseudonocardia oroxyli]SDH18900.1 hypothetical protein SAMN05216377_1209 [Pseudonocardia oroxyli]
MPHVHDEVRITDSVSVASRHYLSAEHLWSALHAARRSRELEAEVAGPGFDPEHRSYVISALLSAVAFLEAVVNEVFEDAVDRNDRVKPLGLRCTELMAETWATSERSLGTLERYQLALLMADKARFGKGENPYQDASSVIGIRNSLTHFKPRWHQHGEVEKLEKSLSGKFDLNPYLAETGNPWFPGKVLSAGCAEWAVNSCRLLAQGWSDRLGLPRYFDESVAEWKSP